MGNGGWSYHNDSVAGYDELVRQMVEIFAKGGNMLRNIGPRPTGEWSPAVLERIRQIGEWLKRNGDSVYGTHRTRLGSLGWGWATASDSTLYLHVFEWPGESLVVEDFPDRAQSARLLADGQALKFRQEGTTLTVTIPKEAPDKVDTVLAVKCRRGRR